MIYLAIFYGAGEGWSLMPLQDANLAMEAVRRGETYGNPWKILRELEVMVHDNFYEKDTGVQE